MRKEVEEIVSANSKEGDSTSTEVLLRELIEINEKQNELLEKNNKSPDILEKIIFVFAGLTLISALASLSLAVLNLNDGKDINGWTIIILTYCFIFIGIIVSGWIIFPNLFKNKESRASIKLFIHNVPLVVAVGLGIGLPIICAILYQFDPIILMMIITIIPIVYLIILYFA